MTEIKALERLRECLGCCDCLTCKEHDEAIEVAINALREKIERENNLLMTLDDIFTECFSSPEWELGVDLKAGGQALKNYGETWLAYRYKKENNNHD